MIGGTMALGFALVYAWIAASDCKELPSAAAAVTHTLVVLALLAASVFLYATTP